MEDRYLFKAKRIDNGEWVTGYYAVIGKRNVIIEKCAENYYCPDTCESRHGNQIHEVNSNTLCQCTRLKDNNGNLIWENDILMCNGNPKDIIKVVLGEFFVIDAETLSRIDKVIGWHYEVISTDALSKCVPFCLSMPLTDAYIETLDIEVIGNIFDNPELLES
nr:MAG TPA: YopX protein [Caudoviricetes sp.]